jgi:PII-like signaling protein
MMESSGPAALLRIYVGDGDRWHHKNLASALAEEALKHELAGATVLRGVEGFGWWSRW